MESKAFIFEQETLWEDLGNGVRRQIMAYNEELMMVKVQFETDAIGSPHTHPHTQATYVVSGIFEFTTENETKTVRAGDSVYIKPNVLHGCKCIEAGILIDAFSPARKDFLPL